MIVRRKNTRKKRWRSRRRKEKKRKRLIKVMLGKEPKIGEERNRKEE